MASGIREPTIEAAFDDVCAHSREIKEVIDRFMGAFIMC
jgi:hypothetical protein